MAPLYDYRCPAGHTFEKNVPMANRNEPVACEGVDEHNEFAPEVTNPEVNGQEVGYPGDLPPTQVRCPLTAHRIEISHSHPSAILDHGMARNRDAAREGRYDPLSPSTRVMGSGRQWRK